MRIKILETQSGRRYIVSEKNELTQYRYNFSKADSSARSSVGTGGWLALQKSCHLAISDRISRRKKSWVKT